MLELDPSGWKPGVLTGAAPRITTSLNEHGALTITNDGDVSQVFRYGLALPRTTGSTKSIGINFVGENLKNGGGCIYLEDDPIPLGATTSFPAIRGRSLKLTLQVPSHSSVRVDRVIVALYDQAVDLTDDCDPAANVLIITPEYPSTHNLYVSAFAHSRNRRYIQSGLRIQVAHISMHHHYQTSFTTDAVPVLKGGYADLKTLLRTNRYRTIVVHFLDENIASILDTYALRQRLIFICHGPETTFRMLPNLSRSYFSHALPAIDKGDHWDLREQFVRQFARSERTHWVFVSDWLRDAAQRLIGVDFKHAHVIHNPIDPDLFPFRVKDPEDRKRILLLRRFDDVRYHSVDVAVRAILELSKRPFFDELEFSVYGDGNVYDRLLAPIKGFKNIKFYRTFVPNDQIAELFAAHGILLIPSRHDAHAVSMGEGTSAGLVVVGSAVTSNPYFMEQELNHTLAEREDYIGLADIIERLYRDPDEFLTISERMSRTTQERCGLENTSDREVALIESGLAEFRSTPRGAGLSVSPDTDPVLTLVVPAYNLEKYLEKCLFSLLDHENAALTEILVVNDGSTDRTAEVVHEYERISGGIVRLIDKENGGHGSTINVGIEQARGTYFRIIDGDDFVDSGELAGFIDSLAGESADIVLTRSAYEYTTAPLLANVIEYDMIDSGVLYRFDDMNSGELSWSINGPLLSTSTFRTETIRRAGFQLSEKRPYVDQEFNAFSVKHVETVRRRDFDIYRYHIGREGQTVSPDFWKKRYPDHEYVIFNILETMDRMGDYSQEKRTYVNKFIISGLVNSQLYMYDQLCLWELIDPFLKRLSQWPDALNVWKMGLGSENESVRLIRSRYRMKLALRRFLPDRPIVAPPGTADLVARFEVGRFGRVKKVIKGFLPYGVIRLRQILLYERHRLPRWM